MAKAWGGNFQCEKNKKHNFNLYFFDSEPAEQLCPYCDDGTKLIRTRVLDMGKETSKRLNTQRRMAKSANPTS